MNGPLFVGDGAFNVSSSQDPLHVGEDSRINPTHSISHPNGWEANKTSGLPNEWISVDLGNVMTIRGITTYGQADAPNWVTSYNMSYSRDGITYVYYQQPYGTIKV